MRSGLVHVGPSMPILRPTILPVCRSRSSSGWRGPRTGRRRRPLPWNPAAREMYSRTSSRRRTRWPCLPSCPRPRPRSRGPSASGRASPSPGISCLHGPHHVAQKLRSTTLPLKEERLTLQPFRRFQREVLRHDVVRGDVQPGLLELVREHLPERRARERGSASRVQEARSSCREQRRIDRQGGAGSSHR